jgi:hypothetical protein
MLFKTMFDGWEDFADCIGYWFTPDVLSLFRGEWTEDWWAEMRLLIFLALVVACTLGAFHLAGGSIAGGLRAVLPESLSP